MLNILTISERKMSKAIVDEEEKKIEKGHSVHIEGRVCYCERDLLKIAKKKKKKTFGKSDIIF